MTPPPENTETTPPIMVVSSGTRLDALDLRSGRLVWQYHLQSTVRRFLLTEDRVYALNSLGELICLELKTGAQLGGLRVVDSGEALLYQRGILYVVGKSCVVALDDRGQQLWSYPLADAPTFGLRGAGIIGQVMQPDYDTNSL